MKLKKPSLGVIIALGIMSMFLVVATAGVLTVTQNLPSTGTITAINLGVYSDSACTVTLTTITWGSVTPGTQVSQVVFVKNTGNVAESLSLATNSWSPSNAGTYLTISWAPAFSTLSAGASTSATITLTASANAGVLSTFSCDIVLTGSA